MPMKLEKKDVTVQHEVDIMHKSEKPLKRGNSVTPNVSLTEAVNAAGNPNRLKVQYNVGKRSETKGIQGLK